MLRIKRIAILLFTVAMVTVSCSSYFKRKECEKLNWYQMGHAIAMRGERVDGDSAVNECKKVEAEINYSDLDTGFKAGMKKYCDPNTVYDIGRRGDFYNFSFCDDGAIRILKKRHEEGVSDYCQAANGFKAGASGKRYNNICPKNLEAAFLPEYYKGRKKYLVGMIEQKTSEISDAENRIFELERDRSEKQVELSTIPKGQIMKKNRVYDQTTRTYKEDVVITEDEETIRRRNNIEDQIRDITEKIRTERESRKHLKSEISELKKELRTLENV